MFNWILYMIIPIYLTYYTLTYGFIVLKKEKNKLGAAFIFILGLSLTLLPIWLRVYK